MPAAIGGIAAYLKEEVQSIDVRLFKYPEQLTRELEAVRSGEKTVPRLVGFSNLRLELQSVAWLRQSNQEGVPLGDHRVRRA
jgi:hypothetical protein